MPAPKRPSAAQLQTQCDAWNAKNAVGTLVSLESIKGEGETLRAKTRSEAHVLSGNSAVIWLEGMFGVVMLDHCTAVAEEAAAPVAPEAKVDIDQMVHEMILGMPDEVETNEELKSVLLARADSIRTISDACKQTGFFANNIARHEQFVEAIREDTPEDERLVHAWTWFLSRIVEAPTGMHRVGSVRLCMPLVAAFLPEEDARA